MITKKDLDEAIMECQGRRNPDASTCMKLAAFYTIRQHLYPERQNAENDPVPNYEKGYSYSAAPDISYSGDSEFAKAVNGRDPTEIMPIMDELMETIKVINPRLYSGVMRRIQ